MHNCFSGCSQCRIALLACLRLASLLASCTEYVRRDSLTCIEYPAQLGWAGLGWSRHIQQPKPLEVVPTIELVGTTSQVPQPRPLVEGGGKGRTLLNTCMPSACTYVACMQESRAGGTDKRQETRGVHIYLHTLAGCIGIAAGGNGWMGGGKFE